MKNRFTLADLCYLKPHEIVRLSPEELLLLQEELAAETARLKRASAALLAGLERRYRDDIKPGTGTQHIEDGDYDVKYELPKRVEWDSEKLSMVRTDAQSYIRVTFDVLESIYKKAPPDIRAVLDDARTVKPGAPKFTITRRGEE